MPVLRFDDYKNHQELLEKIRYINKAYYVPVAKNIVYLQGRSGEVSLIYAVALRDAHSHLAKIFEYEDILATENKIRIVRQLERYMGHLEELLYDTYVKVIHKKSENLFSQLSEGERPRIKKQLAEKIQNVRTVNDQITIEQKIENFVKISDFIEEVFNKHHS